MKRFIQNSLLVVASIAFVLMCVIVADRIVGKLNPPSDVDRGLIFAPYDRAHYDTLEFDVHVQMNNLGFRGDDTTIEKRHKTRVAVLGDSFVFGWGVDLKTTWIKQVEATLQSEGYDVEILNLGAPGHCPGDYANTAERAVPVLKPDIVLVGVLQGNDLEQLDRWKPSPAPAPTQATAAGRFRDFFVGNLVRVSTKAVTSARRGRGPEREIRELWKAQTQQFIGRMSESDRASFEKLSSFLHRAFLNGSLNPAALTWLYPNAGRASAPPPEPRKLEAAKPAPNAAETDAPKPLPPALTIDSRLTRQRIDACAKQLARIHDVAERYGSRMVVVSIPENSYVQTSGWELLFADFATADTLRERNAKWETTVPDDALKAACDRIGVPMLNVTRSFRGLAKKVRFFYEFDGHFTPEGNRFFAESLTPLLGQFLH